MYYSVSHTFINTYGITTLDRRLDMAKPLDRVKGFKKSSWQDGVKDKGAKWESSMVDPATPDAFAAGAIGKDEKWGNKTLDAEADYTAAMNQVLAKTEGCEGLTWPFTPEWRAGVERAKNEGRWSRMIDKKRANISRGARGKASKYNSGVSKAEAATNWINGIKNAIKKKAGSI